MSEENANPDLVELVQRFNDAWNRRDVDAFLSVVAPDVVYRPIVTWPEPQERRGGNEVCRFFIADFADTWTPDFTSRPATIREHGDGVIALLRFTGHARASGIEIGGGSSRSTGSETGRSHKSKTSPTAPRPSKP